MKGGTDRAAVKIMRLHRSLVALPTLLLASRLFACAEPNFDVPPDDPLPPAARGDAGQDASRPLPTRDANVDPLPPAASASVDAGEAGANAGPDPCTLPNLIGCFSFEGTTLGDRSPTKLVPAYIQGITFGAGLAGQGLDVQPTTNIRFAPSAAFNVLRVFNVVRSAADLASDAK